MDLQGKGMLDDYRMSLVQPGTLEVVKRLTCKVKIS